MIILFQRIGETEREREGKRSKSQVNILDVPILIKNYIIAIFIRKKKLFKCFIKELLKRHCISNNQLYILLCKYSILTKEKDKMDIFAFINDALNKSV